jgi:hypothetical protein
MKASAGVGVQLHSILISALDGNEWSAWCSSRFTPDLHWASETFGDVLEKRKIPGVTELPRDTRHARMWSACLFLCWWSALLICVWVNVLDPELDYFVVFERNAQLPATTLAALQDVFQGRRSIRKLLFSNCHDSLSKCLSEFSKILCYAVWVWNFVSHSKGTRYAENGALMGMFEPKREEVTGTGDNYITSSFVFCTARRMTLGLWQYLLQQLGSNYTTNCTVTQ